MEDIFRVATLQDYNTRLVVLTTFILGLASGLIGSFLLLRKRSLMGDALSHACLPGIGLAFIIMVAAGETGKYLPGLLAGAAITGVAGVGLVMAVRNTSRIKDDTAMSLVLSVFFGGGISILAMAQDMPGASAAGLEYFIYGKTASMVMQDFWLLTGVAGLVLLGSLLLMKEFTLLCFDEGYGKSLGWPVHTLDLVMLALVTLVTVVGLQAVGLILIIAFLITPAAAARFWTENLKKMLLLAAVIGALSGWLGAAVSALLPRLPAGAVIVLTAASLFLLSMIFGSARGVLKRALGHARLKRKVGRQHLLRAVYEIQEAHCENESQAPANVPVPFDELSRKRSWTLKQLRKLIQRAGREDHIESFDGETLSLSESGYGEAARITRNHRLWEIFLITHADIAASHVDRDADSVEHVLSPDMVRELEQKLDMRTVPASPHPLNQGESLS
ncbi:metal ABC transporter permease [Ruficoccus amylovorans]|uniref:Metal ABC transporter permease n=2 Tax=Ruficoccus amylovorans TaxID=1804625 RepID=A0A842HC18_9BACT|nr:metal ABC transporter permease [Ruficoccus amylovorans]